MKRILIMLAICTASISMWAHPQDNDTSEIIPIGSELVVASDINLLPTRTFQYFNETENEESGKASESVFFGGISCRIDHNKQEFDRVIKAGTVYKIISTSFVYDRNNSRYSTFEIKINSTSINSITCVARGDNQSLMYDGSFSIGLLRHLISKYFQLKMSAPVVVR